MSSPNLSKINIYPAKSIGGIAMSSSWVEKQGLSFDRRFLIAQPDGAMVTARKYPQMVLVKTALTADGVTFSVQGKPALHLRYCDFSMQEHDAQVWADQFTAYQTTAEANAWFSDVLGQRVTLLYCGAQSNRVREKVGHNVSFADGYPVLVIGEASLEELNRRSSQVHSMDQFRTNLVVSNTEPFEEDRWKRIRIGEVEFESVKPCERCILTTVDVEKGEFRASKEPLATLSQFRANEAGGVFFGQNLVAKNEGMIRAGDRVEVLEYKAPEVYADNSPVRHQFTCVEREEIARDFVTFWLEPDPNAPAFSYQPGQHLPIQLQVGNQKISRYYTLSSSPSRPRRVAISVKRIDGGEVSNWLQDNLHVGDVLMAEQPNGTFHLAPHHHNQPLLLLSAGSGVTPMLSMLRYLSDQKQMDDVVFYHQCRSVEDIPCLAELDELKRQHPGLKVLICLTQAPVDWFGLKGRISLSHIKQIKDLEHRQVFVCGPEGFMAKAKNLMLKKGLPEEQYHQEAFGVARTQPQPFKALTLSVNGEVFQGDNQSTLLEQAENAGVAIANSCRAGLCGSCQVRVESGDIEQPDVPAMHGCDEQTVLACCCVPQSNIEVVSV
ncbi:hybrid-cluster NAD(P)-dependent oxidoreductase [Vibrio sp. AK197]